MCLCLLFREWVAIVYDTVTIISMLIKPVCISGCEWLLSLREYFKLVNQVPCFCSLWVTYYPLYHLELVDQACLQQDVSCHFLWNDIELAEQSPLSTVKLVSVCRMLLYEQVKTAFNYLECKCLLSLFWLLWLFKIIWNV